MTAVLTRQLPGTPLRRRLEIAVRADEPPPAISTPVDVVDQWGMHSFPASDPPSNW